MAYSLIRLLPSNVSYASKAVLQLQTFESWIIVRGVSFRQYRDLRFVNKHVYTKAVIFPTSLGVRYHQCGSSVGLAVYLSVCLTKQLNGIVSIWHTLKIIRTKICSFHHKHNLFQQVLKQFLCWALIIIPRDVKCSSSILGTITFITIFFPGWRANPERNSNCLMTYICLTLIIIVKCTIKMFDASWIFS